MNILREKIMRKSGNMQVFLFLYLFSFFYPALCHLDRRSVGPQWGDLLVIPNVLSCHPE